MMDKNPLLKYMMKSKTDDVMHTSVYAKAQNDRGFGASSSKSFEERMKMEQSRTRVRAYGDSKLMNASFGQGPRPKVYEAKPKTETPPVRKNPGISR